MNEDEYTIRRYELPKNKQPRIIKEKTTFSSIYFKIKVLFVISLTLLIIIIAMKFIKIDKIRDMYKNSVNSINNITKETFVSSPEPKPKQYILPPNKNKVIDNFNKDTQNSIEKMQQEQKERMRKYKEEQAKKIAEYQAKDRERMSRYIGK